MSRSLRHAQTHQVAPTELVSNEVR